MTLEGTKEVLGLWTSASEGAKFSLQILTELRNRGVPEVLVACVDGLQGFPEAIAAVYAHTEVQLYLVHTIRTQWYARRRVAAGFRHRAAQRDDVAHLQAVVAHSRMSQI